MLINEGISGSGSGQETNLNMLFDDNMDIMIITGLG